MWENILKILQRYGDVYLEGLAGTLWIAALTVVAGTVIGIILAVFRLGKCRPCEWFVRFYIWIIRGTPSLLQLYFFYLFLPKVLPIEISETESVVIALIISAGAYVSEIIRAGIQAVDPGQTEAASCLGLSRAQTLRFIILPQAVKNILPALGTEHLGCDLSLCHNPVHLGGSAGGTPDGGFRCLIPLPDRNTRRNFSPGFFGV